MLITCQTFFNNFCVQINNLSKRKIRCMLFIADQPVVVFNRFFLYQLLKLHVILTGHDDIDIIIPGDKVLVPYSTQKRSAG